MSERTDPVVALKEQLRAYLVDALEGWSQVNAGAWLGTDQPRVSDLRRGRLDRISLELLVRFAARIKRRVELTIHDERPHNRRGTSP